MKYLEEVLGVQIKLKDWEGKALLPYYITSCYDIKRAKLKNVDTIFLFPKNEISAINTISLYIRKIQEVELLPVVICLKEITYVQRQQLIKADIPFVVEGKQIYIPFIGALLIERYITPKASLKYFAPSTQALLLYLIYTKTTELFLADAAEALGLSRMAISKAQRQLEKTALFALEQRSGKKKALVAKLDFKTIWERCYQYMVTPVKECVYLNKDGMNEKIFLAGDSALAERSMLNPSRQQVYALFIKNKVVKDASKIDLVWEDGRSVEAHRYRINNEQIRLELWKYDPAILSKNNSVDVLSLALTYKNNTDERVEEAVNEMLETFWEDY